MRILLVFLALLPAAVYAQPAEPPPPAPPSPPPPAEAPPPPAPPPSPADACLARRHALEDQATHTTDLNERARLLQALPDCAHPETAMTAPPVETGPTAAPIAVEAATGFAIELALETSLVQLDNTTGLPLPQAAIFLGYRTPGVTFGLGFDFDRIGSSNDSNGSNSGESSTSFLILPGVRVPLAHSADGRTELLGRVDAGWGQISKSMESEMTDIPSTTHLRVQAAPAVRFWVTHSFGVGAAVGLRYDWLNVDTSGGGVSASMSTSTLALFSSFHVVGVF